jgi:hypothetical protein
MNDANYFVTDTHCNGRRILIITPFFSLLANEGVPLSASIIRRIIAGPRPVPLCLPLTKEQYSLIKSLCGICGGE